MEGCRDGTQPRGHQSTSKLVASSKTARPRFLDRFNLGAWAALSNRTTLQILGATLVLLVWAAAANA